MQHSTNLKLKELPIHPVEICKFFLFVVRCMHLWVIARKLSSLDLLF